MNKTSHHITSMILAFTMAVATLTAAPALAAGAGLAPATTGPVYYVNGSAAPGGDGSTWTLAYRNLQDAIQAVEASSTCGVNTCQIWVAQGTYTPADGQYFYINGGDVAIYGGFAGGETDLAARDWRLHPATLHGNNSNVIYAYYFTGVLDGFTITGGNTVGNVSPSGRGGGINLECGGPGLFNLNIVGNSASVYGGGLYRNSYGCISSSAILRLINVVFSANSADYGGGMTLLGGSPTLTNVVFTGNSVTIQGDGIYDYNSSPALLNVSMSGDGIYNYSQSSPTIQNSIIWGGTFTNEGSAAPSISYSLVQECKPGGTWNNTCGTDLGHNLADINPNFVSTVDLHLQVDSPAIDKGDKTLIPGYLSATDIDGNPRVVGLQVDLGAYEYQLANTPPVVTNFTRSGWKNTDISFTASDFTTNFTDADGDSLASIRITFLPSQGTLYLAASEVTDNQVIPLASLSSLHFTPPADWGGPVSLGWTASDGKVYATNPAVVTIRIYSYKTFIPSVKK